MYSLIVQLILPSLYPRQPLLQIVMLFHNKSENREVWSFAQSHTNLSYLLLDPNHRIQH